jgi:hypothetical protein
MLMKYSQERSWGYFGCRFFYAELHLEQILYIDIRNVYLDVLYTTNSNETYSFETH